jgi:membrane associated rhomboid family serine protease
MFIPLHDDTPLRVIRFQFVTIAIIVLNVAVFLIWGAFSNDVVQASIASGFGVVPSELFNGGGVHNPVPEPLTLITYLFLHGGWMHLIGNMLFLWVFADNVEDAFGYIGFIIFYLLCGAVAGLVFAFMAPGSENPLIGASGAVSGVLASYLVLYPRARVWILLFLRIPVPLPAVWVLGGWFLLQVFSLAAAGPHEEVAWWAHIGGFAVGLILTAILRNQLMVKPNSRN